MDIEDNLHVFVFTLTLSSGSKSVLFLYLIIQKPSKSAVKHTLSLWNVHIHSRMLCLYYPTHCEVTLLVWVVSRLMFLKVALFMKGKLWFSKRTAFCLFVIIVKNLREGFFFFFFSKERRKLLERGVYNSDYSLTKQKSWLQSNKVRLSQAWRERTFKHFRKERAFKHCSDFFFICCWWCY